MATLTSVSPSTDEILQFLSRPAQTTHDTAAASHNTSTVTAIAVTSLDGRGAVEGTSGQLGNDTDATVFNTLRALADVVFVGTGTIASEGYGPVEIPEYLEAVRQKLGRSEHVAMSTLSRSLDLDIESDFFANAEVNPPIIFTPTEDAFNDEGAKTAHKNKAKKMESAGARVVKLPNPSVKAALTWLAEHGYRDIVVEGGPTMYREAFKKGCVDELFLTLSPMWVGNGPLAFGENDPDDDGNSTNPQAFEVRDILRSDSHIFLRYSRSFTQ
ncbi:MULTISPECIES: dihydrofolate reductase family protein [Corynebacterium]|uniref:dihydrofolate reductase family protein n=1 Tax=Corynebacterium TaxID=1716 RepID=UPI0006662852|nr:MULTISPECIES: dihydrofolate reductase family protein [Corynebacterium]KAA9246647.1 riboflavin biosynthesis protein RibD [Corynebacterium amycolatum]MBC6768770.1 riboflavin biosynthesis protein RibD [Corynebacterium sp. LK15]MBC6832134.1 riboflavin biosynthesis protein RibD [Corynebacterium sp. LK29]MCG7269115.1 dihydrofolate reductase family protein [Corynebacterium amycolatum]MCQ9171963.1 dihydrofolate reductase family protein [Corynebacterium amycolatum]